MNAKALHHAERKAKRRVKQKRNAMLAQKMGGYNTQAWIDHKYTIERKVKVLGREAVKKANREEINKLIGV